MSILDALTEYACSPDVTVVNLITAWQPTPVFLPGESHGQKSLVGYSPWSHKESDITKWLSSLNRQVTITDHMNKPWHDTGKLISASYISCSDAEASHSSVTVHVPWQAQVRHLDPNLRENTEPFTQRKNVQHGAPWPAQSCDSLCLPW